jgi:uncharacterized membrane protein
LFKKIDSDSKHEWVKHFLILFWKRIHYKELCLHLLKFICRQKLPRRKRLCFWSHCSLLCQTVKFALHELAKRILFWSHCPLLYQTVKFFFHEMGKRILLWSHCPLLYQIVIFSTNWESEYCYPHIAYYCIRLSSSDHVVYLDINYSIWCYYCILIAIIFSNECSIV